MAKWNLVNMAVPHYPWQDDENQRYDESYFVNDPRLVTKRRIYSVPSAYKQNGQFDDKPLYDRISQAASLNEQAQQQDEQARQQADQVKQQELLRQEAEKQQQQENYMFNERNKVAQTIEPVTDEDVQKQSPFFHLISGADPTGLMYDALRRNTMQSHIDQALQVKMRAMKNPEERDPDDIYNIYEFVSSNLKSGKQATALQILKSMPENFSKLSVDDKMNNAESLFSGWLNQKRNNQLYSDIIQKKKYGTFEGAVAGEVESAKEQYDSPVFNTLVETAGSVVTPIYRGLDKTITGLRNISNPLYSQLGDPTQYEGLSNEEITKAMIDRQKRTGGDVATEKLKYASDALIGPVDTYLGVMMGGFNAGLGLASSNPVTGDIGKAGEDVMNFFMGLPPELTAKGFQALGWDGKNAQDIARNIGTLGTLYGFHKAAEGYKKVVEKYKGVLTPDEIAEKVKDDVKQAVKTPPPTEIATEATARGVNATESKPVVSGNIEQLKSDISILSTLSDKEALTPEKLNLSYELFDGKEAVPFEKFKSEAERLVAESGGDINSLIMNKVNGIKNPKNEVPVTETKTETQAESVPETELTLKEKLAEHKKESKVSKERELELLLGLVKEERAKGNTKNIKKYEKRINVIEKELAEYEIEREGLKAKEEYSNELLTENNISKEKGNTENVAKQKENIIPAEKNIPKDKIDEVIPNPIEEFEILNRENSGEAIKPAKVEIPKIEDLFEQPKVKEAESSGVVVKDMPLKEIILDPERFQFRKDIDEKGDANRLKGETIYDKDAAGIYTVWKDPADGKTYLVNGHNRYSLANKTGQKIVPVRYIEASTAEQARAIGAKMNLKEGHASKKDVAIYFKESGYDTPEKIIENGYAMNREIIKDGHEISKLDKPILDKVSVENKYTSKGEITENQAVVIGKYSKNKDIQQKAYEYVQDASLKGGDIRSLPLKKLKERIDTLNAYDVDFVKDSESLFGDMKADDTIWNTVEDIRGDVAEYFRNKFNDASRVSTSNKAEKVEQYVTNDGKIDIERAKSDGIKYDQISRIFEAEKTKEYSSTLKEFAKRIINGEETGKIKREAKEYFEREIPHHQLYKGEKTGDGTGVLGLDGGESIHAGQVGAGNLSEQGRTNEVIPELTWKPVGNKTKLTTDWAKKNVGNKFFTLDGELYEAIGPTDNGAVVKSVKTGKRRLMGNETITPAEAITTTLIEKNGKTVKDLTPEELNKWSNGTQTEVNKMIWEIDPKEFINLPERKVRLNPEFANEYPGFRFKSKYRNSLRDWEISDVAEDGTITARSLDLKPVTMRWKGDREVIYSPEAYQYGGLPEMSSFFDKNNKIKVEPEKNKIDYESVNPNVEYNIKQSAKLNNGPLLKRIKDFVIGERNKLSKQFPLLDYNDNAQARASNLLNVLKNYTDNAYTMTQHTINTIIKPLKNVKDGVVTFSRLNIIRDLAKDIERGKYTGENNVPKELPFAYKNFFEVKSDLQKLETAYNNSPGLQAAMKIRNEFYDVLKLSAVKRGLLPKDVLWDERYFHHKVLEYMEMEEMVAGNPFSKNNYAVKRTGSAKSYLTDYSRAEAEVIFQILRDVKKVDTIRELASYDKYSDVKEKATADGIEFSEALGKYFPDYRISKIDKGTKFYGNNLTKNVINQQLAGALSVGGREPLVLHKNIVEEINRMRNDDSRATKILEGITKAFKISQLFNPMRFPKYVLNNFIGDFDAILAKYPIAVKKLPTAMKELHNAFISKTGFSKDLLEAIDHNVISVGSGLETNLRSKRISNQISGKEDILTVMKDYGLHYGNIPARYLDFVSGLNNGREMVQRYMVYKYVKDRMASGNKMYGYSNPKVIDAIPDLAERAAKVSRDLLIDYGDISYYGQRIRRIAVPFYSFVEKNIGRYINEFRNIAKDGATSGLFKYGAIKVPIQLAKLVTLGQLFNVLSNLWNYTQYPEEAKKVAMQKGNKYNFILGKDEQGDLNVLRFNGAFADFLEFFGLKNYIANGIEQFMDGKDIPLVGERGWFDPKMTVNKVVSQIGPIPKGPMELATSETVYPDVFNPVSIKQWDDYLAKIGGFESVYKYIMGKPNKGGWALFKSTFSYETSPGEIAYNLMKEKEYDFIMSYKGDNASDVKLDKRKLAIYLWKQAQKFGDKGAERKYYYEFMNLQEEGKTDEDKMKSLAKSVQASSPLFHIRKDMRDRFINSLEPQEKILLEQAKQWYTETFHYTAKPEQPKRTVIPRKSRKSRATKWEYSVPEED